MGANLTEGGATFRVWAPAARAVSLGGSFNGWTDHPMARGDDDGHWSKFVAGAKEGDQYKLFVTGEGTAGLKRDPYARSLTLDPPWPNCNCHLTRPETPRNGLPHSASIVIPANAIPVFAAQ